MCAALAAAAGGRAGRGLAGAIPAAVTKAAPAGCGCGRYKLLDDHKIRVSEMDRASYQMLIPEMSRLRDNLEARPP